MYVVEGPVSGSLRLADVGLPFSQDPVESDLVYRNMLAFQFDAGDLDPDGYADLMLPGPALRDKPGVEYSAASVFRAPILAGHGTDEADLAITYDETLPLENGGMYFATWNARDIDGDGGDELLLASYSGVGSLFLFFTPETGRIPLTAARLQLVSEYGESAGYDLALPGDLDGDGVGDLLVGAPGYDGSYIRGEWLGKGAERLILSTTLLDAWDTP